MCPIFLSFLAFFPGKETDLTLDDLVPFDTCLSLFLLKATVCLQLQVCHKLGVNLYKTIAIYFFCFPLFDARAMQ